MQNNCIRIKINLPQQIKAKNKSDEFQETKFWYYLDTQKVTTINELKNDLKRLLSKRFVKLNITFDLYVLDALVPCTETSTILRDNDIVCVKYHDGADENESWPNEFATHCHKKRKMNNNETTNDVAGSSVMQNGPWSLTNIPYDYNAAYELCVFGTSMVKHIRPENINKSMKAYLKSLSGARIKQVHDFVKARTFNHCKYFIITCGSNDCDSAINKINDIIDDYKQFIEHLSTKYQNSIIFCNKLVPRTTTRNSLENFEINRTNLNLFIENYTKTHANIHSIEHPSFEIKENLNKYLYDGVHIHPVTGVPVYVDEIKRVFDKHIHPEPLETD